jgi:hypothetical protein
LQDVNGFDRAFIEVRHSAESTGPQLHFCGGSGACVLWDNDARDLDGDTPFVFAE